MLPGWTHNGVMSANLTQHTDTHGGWDLVSAPHVHECQGCNVTPSPPPCPEKTLDCSVPYVRCLHLAAVVRAGYYLTPEGQAAPCPRGQWRADSNATTNCTKCAAGVTTGGIASTSASECRGKQPGSQMLWLAVLTRITHPSYQ